MLSSRYACTDIKDLARRREAIRSREKAQSIYHGEEHGVWGNCKWFSPAGMQSPLRAGGRKEGSQNVKGLNVMLCGIDYL